MNASETPVEALAFSYLSFGFLMAMNNVWTWIAVVTTAAVSLWRVRTSSSPSPMPKSLNEPLFPSSSLALPIERVAAEQPDESSISSNSAVVCSPTAAASTIFETETRTSSGKFTVYYQLDENNYENDVFDAVKSDDRCEELLPVGGNWEPLMMKLRIMENNMGLYSYQDLSVLDGSIVRLWEGCSRRKTAGLLTFGGGEVVAW